MEKQIGLTEARVKLTNIVNEVMYQKDTYIISRQGRPAVAVVPLAVWEQWQASNKSQKRERLAAIIEEIQAQNADSPLANLDDDQLLETVNELVHEVRDQIKSEDS